MSIKVKLPALPDSSSSHFPKGIIYINAKDNALLKRRDEFDKLIAAVDAKYNTPSKKLNAMEELLAKTIPRYSYLKKVNKV
jgi:hypothetical protein